LPTGEEGRLLALASGIVSAAHSGRSLQHVGKKDKHPVKHARAEYHPQQLRFRDNASQYLTNVCASKS